MSFPPIKELLVRLGLEARDIRIYEQAFSHSSYRNESKESNFLDYERLETLGDSVLSLVVLDISYRHRPEFLPRDLTAMKIDFVQANSLISYGTKIGLSPYIRVGRSIDLAIQNKIIEDVFESLIGAIYLDSGFQRAYEFIDEIMGKDVLNFQPFLGKNKDYKSELQIAFQADSKNSVVYKLIEKEGLDNSPLFTVAVYFQDTLLGMGKGKSKKIAEQEAAKEALGKMVR